MLFGSNKKEKKITKPEGFDGQETINWSSTEGYDAVRQVNNHLRWPSVWGGKTDKTEKVKEIKIKEIKETEVEKSSKTKIEQGLKDNKDKIIRKEKGKSTFGLFLKSIFNSNKVEKDKHSQSELEKNKQVKAQQEKLRQEKIAREKAEKEKLEKERLEKEKLEKEKLEKERLEQEKKKQAKIKAEAEEMKKKAKEQILKANKERNQKIKEVEQENREKEEDRKKDAFKLKENHHQQKNKELAKDKKPNLFELWKKYFEAKKIKQLNKLERKKIKRFADSLKSVEELISREEYSAKEEFRLKMAARKINQIAMASGVVSSGPAVIKKIGDKANNKNESKKVETDSKAEPEKPSNPGKQRVFTDLRKNFEQKSWNKPSLTETNLASGRTTLYFNWSKFWLALVQWLVVTLFFIAISGSMLYLWQQKQRRQSLEVSQRFGRIDQLISLTENEVGDILDFRGRLIVVNDLLNKHIYWSNFFSFLERNTLPNVFYQEFSGDTSGEYLLKARTDSFDSMAKQLKIFRRSSEVIEVSSEGGEMIKVEEKTKQQDGQQVIENEDKELESKGKVVKNQLNFSIKIKIKPEVFLR